MNDFALLLRRLMAERMAGVRALARQVPCDHALVSRLAAGRQSPSVAVARRLDDLLGAGGTLVAAASGRGDGSVLADEAALVGWPALVRVVSAVTLDDLGTGGAASRLDANSAAAKAATVLASWAADRVISPQVMVLSPRQIGLEELRELETTAEAFRAWGHRYGGGLRRKAVVGLLNELADLLCEPHPGPLHARLFGVTAKLAIVAGHMSGDSDRDRMAYRYFTLALDAARESGDKDIAARAIGAIARQFTTDNCARDAVGLTRHTQRSLPGLSPETAALLAACEAWAQAHIGSYDPVARALDRATILTRDVEQPALFGPAELAGIAGACFELLALRHHGHNATAYAERAAAYITDALAQRGPAYTRSHTLDLVGLASVRLCQQEPAEAIQAAQTALEQAAKLRSARTSRLLHRLAIRALTRFPHSQQVSEFADQVRAQVPVT